MAVSQLSEKHEEIMESIWKAAEINDCTMEAVRKKCVVDFTDNDLEFLEKNNLIIKSGNKILFSESGNRIGENIVRRHRLAEVLLTSVLALKTSEMERIACKVEHSLLPEVEEAICTLLGHPEFCPDAKPIPRGLCCRNGNKLVNNKVICLDELKPGERGKVTYIKPDSNLTMEQLIAFGLSPGTIIETKQKTPAYCISFDNTELALDKDIVKSIFVWKIVD